MLNPIFIKATNLSDAWFQTVFKCIDIGRSFTIERGSFEGQKRLEFDYATIHITYPGALPLLPKLNPLLGLPDPVDEHYLDDYLPYLMTGEEKEGESYTYGQRICKTKTAEHFERRYRRSNKLIITDEGAYNPPVCYDEDEEEFLNQMELMIWTYKNKGHRNNQMVLQVGQPSDILLKDPPCVIPESSIITSKGFKRADEINEGDKVLTHKGRFKRVNKVYKRDYSGDMCVIENNFKSKLMLTPEHPVLTYNVGKCYDGKMICKPICRKQYSSYEKNGKICKKLYTAYSPEWVAAGELKDNFMLPFPKLDNIYDEDLDSKFSVNEMWLFGLWLADGDFSNGLRFNLGSHEESTIQKVKDTCKELYNLEPHISFNNTDDTCTRIVFYSKELEIKFFTMFNKYAHSKTIPFEFIFMNNIKLQALIDGIVEGDGHIRKNNNRRIAVYTSSDAVKNMLMLILRKLNINPSITEAAPKDSMIEGRVIKSNYPGFSISWTLDKLKNIGGWFDDAFIINNYNELTKYSCINTTVYNFEVEDDNSYIAEDIVVHNCLRHIDTRIQDGKLHFFPYFRSWDLWGGFPANLAAIEMMKQYCAAQIGVENGEIIASSKGLHIYDYVWEISEAIRGKKSLRKEIE